MTGKTELRRTWNEDGYHFVVLENSSKLMNWFTAYVGVPESHLATALNYEDVPVEVHGGLTFSGDNLPEVDEDGEKPVKWFGWDYNHGFDMDREVTVQEIVEELEKAGKQFREMTAKDVVEHKARFLPDEVLEQVEIVESDNGE